MYNKEDLLNWGAAAVALHYTETARVNDKAEVNHSLMATFKDVYYTLEAKKGDNATRVYDMLTRELYGEVNGAYELLKIFENNAK